MCQAHSKLFQQTLIDIKDKIEPVLKSTSYKDEVKKEREEKDRDKKQDDGKSRWEKDKEHTHVKKEESSIDAVVVKKEDWDVCGVVFLVFFFVLYIDNVRFRIYSKFVG